MLGLLFPARRRRRGRPVRDVLSAESLENRRLLAYTFTLADKTGVTGTGPTDYCVYALGFASYNFSTTDNKAYAQNAFVLGNVGGTPSATPYTFTDLSNPANPAQGGTSTRILPVKLDASNLTFTLPDTTTIPAEGTVPAGASNLPSGRIYVFMVPNGSTALPSISTQAEVAVKDGPTVGLGFTGFTPGAANTFAYEALEFTINTQPNLSTTAAGSLDIDWTSVDQFQFPLTMQATISVERYADTRTGAVTKPFSNTYHVGASNDDGTSYTRNDVFAQYKTFTATEPAWQSLLFSAGGQPAGILSPLSVSKRIATNPLAGYFDTVLDALYVKGPPPGQTLYLQGNETSVLWETKPAVLPGGVHALALWNPKTYPGSSAAKPVWWIKDPRALAATDHSAEYQIFGGTGAFAVANAVQGSFAGEGLGTVLDMLNAAINRGIAMAGPDSGLYGTADETNPAGFSNPVAGSLKYWETQANFYPADVPQNLYAAFLHTAMIDNVPVNHPNPTNPQQSAAGTPMGLSYGFSQDEAPGNNLNGDGDLVSAFVNPQFGANGSPSTTLLGGQIPAVNDGAPITLTLGPWGTLSTVTVNAPQMFTVVENSQDNSFQWPASPVPFADTAATSLQVTLSVSGGTIMINPQAAQKLGLSVGTSTRGPTISGAITALNTLFQTNGGITYTPIPGSLATQTLTTTAVDLQKNTAFATSTIDIVSTAAPVVTAPQVFTVKENTATSLVWPTSPMPFADASSQTLRVTLTVTGGVVAFNGSTATAAGLTVGGAPAAPSISGPIAALNSYFQTAGNVTYTPIAGSVVGQTLTTRAFDGSESGQATSGIRIVAPTPGLPTVALVPDVFTTTVNTPVGLAFTGTPFTDTGAAPGTTFIVTMSTGGAGNGTLAAGSGSGVNVVTSAAGATFTGTLSALNSYFTAVPAKITYTPPEGIQGTRTLSTVLATGSTQSQPATTSIVIGANAAPGVTVPIAFWVPTEGRANLVWPRGLVPFTDSDSNLLTVTLSTNAAPGTGSFAGSRADRAVTVNATGNFLQLTGRPADLNRYFRTAGRITYTAIGPSLHPRTLTVSASDGSGAGQDTAAILVRGRGPSGVPTIDRTAALGTTAAGTPLVVTYDQLVRATGATATANARSVEFLLSGRPAGRLEFWDGTKWIRVPAVLPQFKEPILAPGGQIRWTPPAGARGQRSAFRVVAWDGWKMSAASQVTVNVT